MPSDFEGIDGLILPGIAIHAHYLLYYILIYSGGESTCMAIVGEEYGIFPKLKDWVQQRKPVSYYIDWQQS